MDPIAGGGHNEFGVVDLDTGEISEDVRNLVYCCTECNLKKKDMRFLQWMPTLDRSACPAFLFLPATY
jgi:hypothetical protein